MANTTPQQSPQQLPNAPAGYGTLDFAVLANWHSEKSTHCTDEYFEYKQLTFEKAKQQKGANRLVCCHFCGFPDHEYLELHHLDGDHSNFGKIKDDKGNDTEQDNLVLACSLCHRLHHLGWIGIEGLGKLLYMPPSAAKQVGFHEQFNLLQRFLLLVKHGQDQNQKQLVESHALFNSFREGEFRLHQASLENAYRRHQVRELIAKAKAEELAKKSLESQNNPANEQENQGEEQDKTANKDQERAYNEDDEKYIEEKSGDEFYKSAYLLDILDAAARIDSKNRRQLQQSGEQTARTAPKRAIDNFLTAQRQRTLGFFAMEFDIDIFKPWDDRLGYTLEQRLDTYYNMYGVGSTDGVAEVFGKFEGYL
ncbi:hypothetical protein ACFBZI_11390 [Moraxella sp. ZJ142]|uniref:hypothetical protein n=1 Tax=Moraxella marmotae TaxID=3344520 RepID=UPI0035D427DB